MGEFNALMPAYQINPNPFAQSAGAFGDALAGYTGGLDAAWKTQQGQQFNKLLSSGDYAGAAAATSDPRLGMQALEFQQSKRATDLAYQKQLADMYGGVAQMALTEKDPAKQQAMAQRIFASHPEMATTLQKNGVDPRDTPTALKFLVAQASGINGDLERLRLQSAIALQQGQLGNIPLERQLKLAQIDQANLNIAQAKHNIQQVPDVYGTPQFYETDPISGTVKQITPQMPSGGPAAASGAELLGTPVHGDELLKSVPPAYAVRVKAIGSGIEPPPSPTEIKTKEGRMLDAILRQAYPDYNFDTYNQRHNVEKSFRSGADAANKTSLDTSVGHVFDLANSLVALKNPSGSSFINAPYNAVAGNFDDARAAQLNTVHQNADAVSSELGKAFMGGVPPLSEMQSWREGFTPNFGPKAAMAAVQTPMKLLLSRMDAVARKYNEGMGIGPNDPRYKTGRDFLNDTPSPEHGGLSHRQMYDMLLKGEIGSAGADHSAAGAPAAPNAVRVNSPDEARKLPSGTPIILPDGRTGTVP